MDDIAIHLKDLKIFFMRQNSTASNVTEQSDFKFAYLCALVTTLSMLGTFSTFPSGKSFAHDWT